MVSSLGFVRSFPTVVHRLKRMIFAPLSRLRTFQGFLAFRSSGTNSRKQSRRSLRVPCPLKRSWSSGSGSCAEGVYHFTSASLGDIAINEARKSANVVASITFCRSIASSAGDGAGAAGGTVGAEGGVAGAGVEGAEDEESPFSCELFSCDEKASSDECHHGYPRTAYMSGGWCSAVRAGLCLRADPIAAIPALPQSHLVLPSNHPYFTYGRRLAQPRP